MFNFFSEVKRGMEKFEGGRYNLVNISGEILYVEGHQGITQLTKEVVAFKVKGGRIVASGRELALAELSDTTLKISGKIEKIEVF